MYYPASTLYLACKAAAAVWFNESNSLGQLRCDASDYLTEACRAPVSTNITVTFRGTFSFLSNPKAKEQFLGALSTDLSTVFAPAKIFLARIVEVNRRQSEALVVEFAVDGVSSANGEFIHRYKTLSLYPLAYLKDCARKYGQLSDGGLLTVSSLALGVMDSSDPVLNWTLSPSATLLPASFQPSASEVASTTTTVVPRKENVLVPPSSTLSGRDVGLIAGLSVAVLLLAVTCFSRLIGKCRVTEADVSPPENWSQRKVSSSRDHASSTPKSDAEPWVAGAPRHHANTTALGDVDDTSSRAFDGELVTSEVNNEKLDTVLVFQQPATTFVIDCVEGLETNPKIVPISDAAEC
jgi:hypothetical protein